MSSPSKPILHSKTFWVNILTFIGMMIVYLQENGIVDTVVEIAPDSKLPLILGAALGLVNVGLRLITNKPVSFKLGGSDSEASK